MKYKSGKNQLYNKIKNAFRLPIHTKLNEINILLTGKNQVFIENYRNILEYTATTLKIQGKNCKFMINGKMIFIESYSADMMLVKGDIMEIKFY